MYDIFNESIGVDEMIVKVFEVYSEQGNTYAMFLTEEEANNQTIIMPSEGPYPANVEMTEDEYNELKTERYFWS